MYVSVFVKLTHLTRLTVWLYCRGCYRNSCHMAHTVKVQTLWKLSGMTCGVWARVDPGCYGHGKYKCRLMWFPSGSPHCQKNAKLSSSQLIFLITYWSSHFYLKLKNCNYFLFLSSSFNNFNYSVYTIHQVLFVMQCCCICGRCYWINGEWFVFTLKTHWI